MHYTESLKLGSTEEHPFSSCPEKTVIRRWMVLLARDARVFLLRGSTRHRRRALLTCYHPALVAHPSDRHSEHLFVVGHEHSIPVYSTAVSRRAETDCFDAGHHTL